MAKRHMTRCSTSLTIREIQIKTTMRYHPKPIRMAIINKSASNSTGKDAEKGNPCALLVQTQTGAATVESSMELPHKIKNGTAL